MIDCIHEASGSHPVTIRGETSGVLSQERKAEMKSGETQVSGDIL